MSNKVTNNGYDYFVYTRMVKMRMKFMSCILVRSLCLQVG